MLCRDFVNRGNNMYVRTIILQKKDNITTEDFQKYWLEKHGPLAKELFNGGLKHYCQNHVTISTQLGIDSTRNNYIADGFAQLFFEEGTSLKEMVNEEGLRVLKEDEAHFIGNMQIVITKPNIIVSSNRNKPLIKTISLLKRKKNIDIERFKYEWLQIHPDRVLSTSGVEGYIQHFVVDRTIDKKNSAFYDEVPIDGIEELWFEDIESMEKAFRSENGLNIMEHSKSFLEEITTFVVKEHRVL